MQYYKNHEGYHDPTAGKAIRQAERVIRPSRVLRKSSPLSYQIGEVSGFPKKRDRGEYYGE